MTRCYGRLGCSYRTVVSASSADTTMSFSVRLAMVLTAKHETLIADVRCDATRGCRHARGVPELPHGDAAGMLCAGSQHQQDQVVPIRRGSDDGARVHGQ
eukprot:1868038-Rhodomonas_salina.3